MPRVSEVFSSGLLKAEHLNGQPFDVTINGWAKEMIYGAEAYVLYLAEDSRKLKLSNMLAHDIAKALGGIDEIERWMGGKVQLYPHDQKIVDRDTQLEKTVNMIRARAGVSPTATLVPGPTPPRKPDPDDEIPF